VLAEFDREVGDAIEAMSQTVRSGIERSGASEVVVEFGLTIQPQAGFVVSVSPDSGQLRISMTFSPKTANELG
jgi:hypothetical protein